MKLEKKKNNNFLLISILFLLSTFILLIFSTSTSPLYKNYYEDDSSIFIVMGKAIKSGFIPYKDIFDHKGPILFLIETIGQYIFEGRLGIFIIQIISLTITNYFLFKIAQLFCDKKKSMFSVLFSMSIFICFFEEGNLSEEFSLPFLAICLYLAIDWILHKEKTMLYSIIFGICFAIISLIRLNNAAIIVGLVLAILFILIKNKQFKKILICALNFIFGMLIIYLPTIIYFYNNSAVYDMIYGTFIHNFKYAQNVKSSDFLLKLYYNFHLLILMITMYKKIHSNKELFTLIYTATIIIIIVLFIGPGFTHYYLIGIPLVIVFMANLLDYSKNLENNIKKFIYVLIIVVSIIYILIKTLLSVYYISNMNNVTVQSIQNIVQEIPDTEKNSVLAYNTSINASIYLYGDILPGYKYAFLQNNLIKTNKQIYYEMLDYIKQNNIKWILSTNLDEKNNKNDIDKIILEKYELVNNITVVRLDFMKLVEENIYLYKLK